MKDQWLTSVGIDVGTSTTKMIISRLRIARMSSPFALPRYDIVERKVMYESPMLTTPLLSETLIDAERIAAWLLAQYELAGVRPLEVSTGAVIFFICWRRIRALLWWRRQGMTWRRCLPPKDPARCIIRASRRK